jgi:phage terminase small subunit
MANKLTPQQKIFCEEYVVDWNGTRAYKKAYGENKSDSTAAVNASKLLRITKIADYIEEIQSDLKKLTGDSFTSQVEKLKEFMQDDEISRREWLDAFKELNKMYGFYAPEKKQHDHTSDNKKITGFNIVISDQTGNKTD